MTDFPLYPKIQTLFTRDPETFRVTDELRFPEFGLIKKWLVTEKIHGTNTRVHWDGDQVRFGGRTDRAQIPTDLLAMLQDTFLFEKMAQKFGYDATRGVDVTLFGEGYGPRIQKGGGDYRDDPGFRLFDVKIGEWWLAWQDVANIADALEIKTVPRLGATFDIEDILQLVRHSPQPSVTAWQDKSNVVVAEGIVARTDPELRFRNGKRLMFKLKAKDFAGGKD